MQNEQETSEELRKNYALEKESSEERRAKLEEAEKKNQQLQESLKG